MEEIKRHLTESEVNAEMAKPPREIDYNYLLDRGGNQRVFSRVHHAVIYELKQNTPGSKAAFEQAFTEWATSHNVDDAYEWWIARRVNELMGSPLKLSGLPSWDRPTRERR